jgi:hypothetical protein
LNNQSVNWNKKIELGPVIDSYLKVEKILKGIPSHHLTFNENSNYGWEIFLKCKGKTLLSVVNKPINVLPYYLK